MNRATYFAGTSGTCAALGSLCGKLSGLSLWQGSLFFIRVIFFALMLICNGGVWTFYVKALQLSDSSLPATITSSATNFVMSAIMGFLFFGEVTSILWWSGTFIIIVGVMLIARQQVKSGDKVLEDIKYKQT